MSARLALLLAALVAGGCEREQREFRAAPRPAQSPASEAPAVPAQAEAVERNAYHVAEGKRLFVWFNCVGCHAHGGGGMGPALMDPRWIYGSEPQQVFESIHDGRPNGMPAFKGRIPEAQIWQLVAYVRSMGRYVRKDVAPGRADDLVPRRSEAARPRRDDDEAPP